MLADLQQQGGFTDAGVAADEHQPAPHDAAAQHPIQLLQAGFIPLLPLGVDVPNPPGLRPHGGGRPGGGRRALGGAHLLVHGVPLPAGGAFAVPFGRFAAAFRADEHRFRFLCHFQSLPFVTFL